MTCGSVVRAECLTLVHVHEHLPCALCVVQNPAWKSEKYADYYYQSKMGIEPDDAEVSEPIYTLLRRKACV